MAGVWDDEYEDDDFLEFYGEAEEVPEPGQKKTKLIEADKAGEDGKPKKPRNPTGPRPKLDVDRILSDERGLPELLRMASHITFKPGKEVEGVKKTLGIVELWSHRLFPKYTFDDFLVKCETLGKKRPVGTHLKKVRTGLIPM